MKRFTYRSKVDSSRVVLDCEQCVNNVVFCGRVDCNLILMDKLCALEDAVERFETLLTKYTEADLNCEVNYIYRVAVKDVRDLFQQVMEGTK